MSMDATLLHTLSPLQQALVALDEMEARIEAMQRQLHEPIAVIGMACRFPGGADDPEQYWQLLRDGRDVITEVPADRWPASREVWPYARHGGFVTDIDQFDASFFGITPREAVRLDPQQRLLLELGWEALEGAGYAPEVWRGTSTGVFVGIGINDYARLYHQGADLYGKDVYNITGNGFCFASGRLSHTLGLQGPSLSIDTACSSSLVAVHVACQSLRLGECRQALAGGVHLMLTSEITTALCQAQALAPDGRCKVFDASANGYVRGEGGGLVVLKRLTDALADGDPIWAVIKGSAINHDGPSGGLTVPHGGAQETLIRQALMRAGVAPHQIDYVEAHGTGTALGDPIEVAALGQVYGEGRDATRPLFIGSVKTHIGHLEAAAGIAGIIKVILALRGRCIPPHLHCQHVNPRIDLDRIPACIPTTPTPWPEHAEPYLAGVSAFGLSGTNAHVVVEAAAPSMTWRPARSSPRAYELLTFSAPSPSALVALAQRYRQFLIQHPEVSLYDMAYTLNLGRSRHAYRLAMVVDGHETAVQQLDAFVAAQPSSGWVHGHVEDVTEAEHVPPDVYQDLHEAQSWECLGDAFVAGKTIAWASCYQDPQPHRLVLPTYPFQRQRYWVDAVAPAVPPGSPAVPLPPRVAAHPMLGERLPSPLSAIQFQCRWHVETLPLLSDHRIAGQMVVSGFSMLAMVIEAAAQLYGDAPVALEEVSFRTPIHLDEGAGSLIQLVLEPLSETSHAFTLFAAYDTEMPTAPSWAVHVEGRMRPWTGEVGDRAFGDLGGPNAAAPLPGSAFYRDMERLGYHLGERYQWIDNWVPGERDVWAQLTIPDAARDEIGHYRLHPGLADACIQTFAGVGLTQAAVQHETARHQMYVPFSVAVLYVYQPSGSGGWCYSRITSEAGDTEMLRGDTVLTDGVGAPILQALDVRLRRIAPQRAETAARQPAPPAWSGTSGGRFALYQPEVVHALRRAQGREQEAQLMALVRAEIAAVMELRDMADLPGPRQKLFEFGIDSVMALEIKNRVESRLGIMLPATIVFEYPTLEQVVHYLQRVHFAVAPPPLGAQDASPQDTLPARTTVLDHLSTPELETLLDEELARANDYLRPEP